MRMGAAAFLARFAADNRGQRIADQVIKLKRFHQIAVPDQAAIGDFDIAIAARDLGHFRDPFLEQLRGTEHRRMGLHGALHGKAKFGHIGAALGVPHAIKAIQARLTRLRRQRRLGSARLDGLRRAMRCRAAKNHKVKQ